MAKNTQTTQRLRTHIRNLGEGNFFTRLDEQAIPTSYRQLAEDLNLLAVSLDNRFRELCRLQEAAAEVTKGAFLEEILSLIYDSFHEFIPYDRIGCAMLSDDQTMLRAYWARFEGRPPRYLKPGFQAPLQGSSLEPLLHTGEPRIINDLVLYLKEHPNSHSTHLAISDGIRSSLTCPLRVAGKALGFLFFSSSTPNTYHRLHQEVFLFIARQVSNVIEKARIYQQVHDLNQQLAEAMAQLKEQSCRDALTGVLNRGAIMEFFSQCLQQANRSKQSLAVIMIDLDHFKKINDGYGHPVGDRVLAEVAKTMRDQLRLGERLGRYGGEEFLLILDHASPDSAMGVAERLRESIASIVIEARNRRVPITASIGVCVGLAPEQALLERADAALYRAKEMGRNRVQLSPAM